MTKIIAAAALALALWTGINAIEIAPLTDSSLNRSAAGQIAAIDR